MGRYTVLPALSTCEDNMFGRSDAIRCCHMFVKFCGRPRHTWATKVYGLALNVAGSAQNLTIFCFSLWILTARRLFQDSCCCGRRCVQTYRSCRSHVLNGWLEQANGIIAEAPSAHMSAKCCGHLQSHSRLARAMCGAAVLAWKQAQRRPEPDLVISCLAGMWPGITRSGAFGGVGGSSKSAAVSGRTPAQRVQLFSGKLRRSGGGGKQAATAARVTPARATARAAARRISRLARAVLGLGRERR